MSGIGDVDRDKFEKYMREESDKYSMNIDNYTEMLTKYALIIGEYNYINPEIRIDSLYSQLTSVEITFQQKTPYKEDMSDQEILKTRSLQYEEVRSYSTDVIISQFVLILSVIQTGTIDSEYKSKLNWKRQKYGLANI